MEKEKKTVNIRESNFLVQYIYNTCTCIILYYYYIDHKTSSKDNPEFSNEKRTGDDDESIMIIS
jgi:hypothetical protein